MARHMLNRMQGLPTEVVTGTGVWKTFTFGEDSPGDNVPPAPPADAEATKPAAPTKE